MSTNRLSQPFVMAAAVLAVAGSSAWPAMSQAQGLFGNAAKPIMMVIPTGPGASNDLETRMYGQKLTELTGQAFIADYKPGAGTTLAAAYVAKAAPDGYTLVGVSSSFTAAAALYDNLPYDPLKDFAPVTLMSKRSTVIMAHPSMPFKNVQEYIAYTKANPGAINIATVGSGSGPHINAEWFHMMANTKVTFVHYKSAAAMQSDLLSGRVQMTWASLLTGLPHIRSGNLRLIAIGNTERSPLVADGVPAAEQGMPGYDYGSMYALLAPGGTPPAIVNRLATEFARVVKSPDVAKKLDADGGFAVGSTPQQLSQLLATEIARYRKIVRDGNIKSEQ